MPPRRRSGRSSGTGRDRRDDRDPDGHPDQVPEPVDEQLAVAAGVTSIATTRMIPTAWMLTTIVTPTRPSSR